MNPQNACCCGYPTRNPQPTRKLPAMRVNPQPALAPCIYTGPWCGLGARNEPATRNPQNDQAATVGISNASTHALARPHQAVGSRSIRCAGMAYQPARHRERDLPAIPTVRRNCVRSVHRNLVGPRQQAARLPMIAAAHSHDSDHGCTDRRENAQLAVNARKRARRGWVGGSNLWHLTASHRLRLFTQNAPGFAKPCQASSRPQCRTQVRGLPRDQDRVAEIPRGPENASNHPSPR